MQVLAGGGAPWVPYLGYIGTWAILEASMTADGAEGAVEHRIESATLPELIDDDPGRPFTITSNRLTLGDNKTYRRQFQRVMPLGRLALGRHSSTLAQTTLGPGRADGKIREERRFNRAGEERASGTAAR